MYKNILLPIIIRTHSLLKMKTMLDFIKDIFSAFRQSSIERIKNPFVGAFVFSWLGFNWQVLAIILFSKKDVIERIDYIKDQYDVGHFILGPVLITIVICIILPWANKIFTKYQSKPIGETTDIIMQSKIDIAEKQMIIAKFDAKKKLAEKLEARNIEEGIDSIKQQIKNEVNKNNELTESLKDLSSKLKVTEKYLSDYTVKLENSNKMVENLSKDIESKIGLLKNKTDEITGLNREKTILQVTVENMSDASKSIVKEYGNVFSMSGERLVVKSGMHPELKKLNLREEEIPF